MSNIELNKKYAENDTASNRETILISGLDELQNDIEMFGPNKIALFMMKNQEMEGVLIHSESLYQSLMAIFKLVWLTHSKRQREP
jgi:hypothetical protein